MTKDMVLSDAFWGLDPFLRVPALPSTDIWTEGAQLFVRVQLPGFSRDDIEVSLESGDLMIRAHHQESERDKQKKYVVRESTNSFTRRVRLPEFAEAGKITAEHADGVLTITVPTGAMPQSTSIPITNGK